MPVAAGIWHGNSSGSFKSRKAKLILPSGASHTGIQPGIPVQACKIARSIPNMRPKGMSHVSRHLKTGGLRHSLGVYTPSFSLHVSEYGPEGMCDLPGMDTGSGQITWRVGHDGAGNVALPARYQMSHITPCNKGR